MMKNQLRIGQTFTGMYPVHGTMNILRNVTGEIIEKGRGPNGPFIVVQEDEGKIRSLSTKKIVRM